MKLSLKDKITAAIKEDSEDKDENDDGFQEAVNVNQMIKIMINVLH